MTLRDETASRLGEVAKSQARVARQLWARLQGVSRAARRGKEQPAPHLGMGAPACDPHFVQMLGRLVQRIKKHWPAEVFLGLLECHPSAVPASDIALALRATAAQLEVIAKREEDQERARRKQLLSSQLKDRHSGLQKACSLL